MRQAGRYLPEYRELRSRFASFLDFCLDPVSAIEATLQPIRRFGFDAAILFSDILVIPHALGQEVSFEAGEGPWLRPISGGCDLARLSDVLDLRRLAPVFETIRRVRALLPASTDLIGFCGAPWTVASYMVAGQGTRDQQPARLLAYREPEIFKALIDLLVDASIAYLDQQFEAGVDAVQIFDSWSGVLPTPAFEKWCIDPIKRLVAGVKARRPAAKIILYSRVASSHLTKVAQICGADAVGLDTTVDPAWAAREIQPMKAVQGNLDPMHLLAGGSGLEAAIDDILEAFAAGPHIFNLGLGILPETPLRHVERLVRRIQQGGRQ